MLDCYHSYLHRFMKYAMVRCVFDSSSLIEGAEDVAYDGYESLMNKIILTYNLAYY